MGKGFYYATYGYDFSANQQGLFVCGCGSKHVFESGVTLVIMWDGPEQDQNWKPWYLQCAFESLLWRLQME